MPLTLTRRIDERVFIGADICIQIGDIGRDGVRLIITAPDSVGVYREEVAIEMKREGRDPASRQRSDGYCPRTPTKQGGRL
jgi:carbon storage regulator